MADALVVTGLARLGDGIAHGDDGRVLVRGALPGDTVTGLVLDGVIDAPHFIARGPMHATPPCADFGTCGGCQLQHMTHDAYVAWKRQRVVDALAAQRIEADVAPLTVCEPRSRRRAGFSIRHTANGVELGFQEARSHAVVAFEECHVVLPVLNMARGALTALAKAALPMMAADAKPATASVTVTKSGLDVALSDVERLNADRREAALKIALKANFSRLSINGELIVETRKPVVAFDGIAVDLPGGGFLQAVAGIETAMRDAVTTHLASAKRIADLFSGCGTFSLPLAKAASVHAVEADGPSLAALDGAWRRATSLKTVTVERRDLYERPVTAAELEAFDGLVFDPPRAGAEDQACEIAKSQVRRVAAVSCNPDSLARDLRILMDGGYRLVSVAPFDQFLWSHHVEAVALLERPKTRSAKAKRRGW